MKIGRIRCMMTEDYCPGTKDFKAVRKKSGVFEGIEEDIVIVGFINCGGCPAKKSVLRARKLIHKLHHHRQSNRLSLPICQRPWRSGEVLDYTH